jgi:hypothetical protein
VFDRTVELADVADGYRAMADRKALKVLIQPDPRARPGLTDLPGSSAMTTDTVMPRN